MYPWWHGYLLGNSRRVFGWSLDKKLVYKRTQHGDLGHHRCESCLQQVPRKDTHVDHIQPCVPVTGWVSWDSYFSRLFVSAKDLQLLCKKCHSTKTKAENIKRKEFRK